MRFLLFLILPTFIQGSSYNDKVKSFSVPDNCIQDCTFKVSWFVKNRQVEFTVSARVEKGKWAGIGFSRDRKMVDSDAVVAWMTRDDSMVVTDRYLRAKSVTAVPVDKTNNVEIKNFTQTDGLLTFTFIRDIVTGDSDDLPLNEAFYLIYAWGGEGFTDNMSITKHTDRGIVPDMIRLGENPTEATPNITTMETMGMSPSAVIIPTTPSTTRATVKITIPAIVSSITSTSVSTPLSITQTAIVQEIATIPTSTQIITTQSVSTQPRITSASKVNPTLNTVNEDDLDEEAIQERLRIITNVEEGPIEDRMIPEITRSATSTALPTTQSSKLEFVKTCAEKTCPSKSHCVVEHEIARCYCDTGYDLDDNGNCVASKAKTTEEKCAGKMCPDHASCKEGICICLPGYVLSAGICIASTSKRDQCIGVRCSTGAECKKGFCVCTNGAPYQNERCTVTTSTDERCVGVKCPENAECKRGYCFCKSTYFNFKGRCQRETVDKDPCDDRKCSENAVCSKGRCSCKEGYFRESNGKCRAVQNKCLNVKCVENAICNNGRCSCKPGYVHHGDGTCKKQTKDKCANTKCIENAECRRGYCFCKSGYKYSQGKCRARDRCSGVRCSTNSYCANGVCVCKSGYVRQSDGQCRVPRVTIINKCSQVQCPANSKCQQGVCRCKTGYYRQTSGRCTVPSAVPSSTPPAVPADRCQSVRCPENAVCKSGFCFCKRGYIHRGGQCKAAGGPKMCANLRCPENSECRMGKCYCKTGYISSNGKCLKIVQTTCTRLNCGPNGRCVTRNGKPGCVFSNTRPQHGSQNSGSTHRTCRNKCGHFDHARRCFCSSSCLRWGSCCDDYRAHCGGSGGHGYGNGYYPYHG